MAVAAPIGARLEPPPPPPPPIVDPVSGRLIDPITRLPVAPVAQPAATPAPAALPPGVEPARIAPFTPQPGAQPAPAGAETPQPPEAAGNSPGNGLGVKLELGLQPHPTGAGAKLSVGQEHLHGNTAYSGTIQVGRQVGFEQEAAKKGGFSGSGSVGNGVNANFELVVPDSNGPLTAEQAAAINPFDVRTLPPGASVKVDLAQFAGTEYEAQVRHVVVSEGVRYEAGVTYQAQRSADGRSAERAIGPYAMVEKSFGIGGQLGPVTAQLGNSTQLRGNLLAKEKLDIAGPQNVSQGVTRTSTLEYVSESGINLGIGDAQLKFGLGENAGLSTITQNPDGTIKQTGAIYYGSAPPLTVERTFRPDGSEIAEQRSYSYTVQVDQNSRQLLHAALGGSLDTAANSPLQNGDTVVLRYNTQQMAQLQQQHRDANAAVQFGNGLTAPGGTHDFRWRDLDPQTSFALSLVHVGQVSNYSFAQSAFEVSDFASGAIDNSFVRNPADAWIVNPGQPPRPFAP